MNMKLIYSRIRKKEKEAASDKISVAAFLNVVGCVFLKKNPYNYGNWY